MWEYEPILARWDLTGACTWSCMYCSASGLRSLGHSSAIIAKRIVESGVLRVGLLGGEPLLHPELTSVLKTFARAGVHVTVNTSGYGLTREFLNSIEGYGVSFVVSIDSMDPRENDLLRGYGSLQTALKAFDLLLTEKASTTVPFSVSSATTITKVNAAGVPALIGRLLADNTDTIHLSRVHRMGRAIDFWPRVSLSHEEYLETVRACMDVSTKVRANPRTPLIGRYLNAVETDDWRYRCRDALDSYHVMPSGDAYPSEAVTPLRMGPLPPSVVQTGNSLVTSDFYTVWNGGLFESFRKEVLEGSAWRSYYSCVRCPFAGKDCSPSPAGFLWSDPDPYELCSYILGGVNQEQLISWFSGRR